MGLVVLLWGLSFAGMRYCLASLQPGSFALLRYLTASACLLVLACWRRPALPTRRELPRLLAVAAAGIAIYNLLLSFGISRIQAGPGSFINNSIPVFSSLLAAWLLRERPTPLMWTGTLISLGGVALIARAQAHGQLMTPAAGLLLISACCYASYNVLQKPLLDRHGAVWLVSWAIWLGTLMLLPWAPGLCAELGQVHGSVILITVLIGLLPTVVAFLLWSWCLRRCAVTVLVPVLYLVPVISLVASRLVLQERPSAAALLGCAVVVAGVILVGRGRTRPVQGAASPPG